VVERGTVAAAAARMRYTAPAVSQQITKLEQQLDTSLFDRVGGRLKLSHAGERLVPVAQQMLELIRVAQRAKEPDPVPCQVTLAGFASSLGALVVPLLASRLGQALSFVVHEAEDEAALRDLRLGHVDLAIVQEYDGPKTKRPERLTFTPLLSDRLRLIAPKTYPRNVRIEQLEECGWWVNGAGTRCEEATQRILAASGIAPRVRGRVADNATLLALVAAGHGASIAPELVLAGRHKGLTVARVDLKVRRTIFGVTRSTATAELQPVLRELVKIGAASLNQRACSSIEPADSA
jgi:DNA-binding transcriptional LysR family regulator